MDVRQIIGRYDLDEQATDLLFDACQAMADAEMHGTLTFLRGRVFGTGRAMRFDQRSRRFTLRPFVELALLELRDLADNEALTVRVREERAAATLRLAGFV